ncbi:transposase family protein, partial [Duncaniella muris]
MKPLDQVCSTDAYAPDHTAKVHNKFDTRRSIMEELRAFASSVPDFRRLDKGNFRHSLNDIIMLMILGRMAGCIGRAEILEFGRYNLNKLHKMGLLRNGVPSEATLCRVENGINDMDMADRMQQFADIFLERLTCASRIIEIICIDG